MALWDETKQALRATLEPMDFVHWIRPVHLVRAGEREAGEGHEIVLGVPDDSHGQWLAENFLGEIRRTLQELTTHDYEVRFEPVPGGEQGLLELVDPPAAEEASPSDRRGSQGAPGPSRLSGTAPSAPSAVISGSAARAGLVGRYRFEHFVDGPNSRFALGAARAAADHPGTRYNPLFLYGGVGLGKTHLLHAVGHAVQDRDPRARVLYVTSEAFVNEFIAAIRTDRMDAFRARYRDGCDVLLVDDIQFIAGRERTQEEFFHLFNTLHSSHKQIVVTSDEAPGGIDGLEERLRSRLGWGLLVDVKPPCFETRVAIAQRKAQAEGLELPEAIAMRLARHITRNVRELEGALVRLGAASHLVGRPIDEDLVEEVLGDLGSDPTEGLTPERILEATARSFGVNVSDLKGPRRYRHVLIPRQAAMWLVRQLTPASLPHIGMIFGGRDHSTVLNALKRIDGLRKQDKALDARIRALEESLGGV